MLHVIALAQYAMAYTRSWAVNGRIARVGLKAENDQLKQGVALLAEEMRIKDARMKRIDPQKRPHYVPTERMAILKLGAARAWSVQQTAEAFLVTAATIASWMKRIDEGGSAALVQIREPVNKFPDFVRYAVQRLKGTVPKPGQGQDRRDAVPCGPAPRCNDGRTDPQRTATPDATADSRIQPPRRDCQARQPRLAHRPDHRARGRRLLGTLVAVRAAAVLAILLVAGRGH